MALSCCAFKRSPQYTRQQRHDADPERWIMASRNAAAAAAAAKREGTHERLLQKSRAKCESSEDAPSHARMRSVIKNDDYDDAEDDEQGAQRRRARPSQEQSDDEFEFEEEFADDEEGIAKIDDMADEEETKELEERIKREMRAVERADQGEEDEAAGADAAALTSTGREMRKLVKKFEKTDVYESADEDDDNPYVSVSQPCALTCHVVDLCHSLKTRMTRRTRRTRRARPAPPRCRSQMLGRLPPRRGTPLPRLRVLARA